MRYKLDTTTNHQDKYEARLYELDYTPQGKKYKTRYRLTMLWYLPCFWIIGYGLWLMDYLYPSDLIAFAIVPLIVVGIWQLLAKSVLRRQLLRQVRREEKMFGFGPSEAFYYDDGFCNVTDDIKYDVQYRNVRKAVLYKSRYFFLCTKKMLFIVPCCSLNGQATVPEFADFLRSRGVSVETID